MKTDGIEMKVSCDILFENLQSLKQSSDLQFEELTIEKMFQASGGMEKILYSLDVHSDSLPAIAIDFKIFGEDLEKLQTQLKSANALYLIFYANSLNHKIFEKYLKRVDQIAKAAEKLRDLLNSGGNDFAHFLEWVNHYEEKDEGEPTANKFLHDAVNMLNILIRIKSALPESEVGKAGLYKSRGRPRNQALNFWVETLYFFWVNVLKRSMQRDPEGIGGRKQFLEFLDCCIKPLHPEMMSYNSDSLDTALKELQKKRKRGEKSLYF